MWNPFRPRQSRQQHRHSPSDLVQTVDSEIGHALSSPAGRTAEDNWDLRFPRSTEVFAKMGREDAQVTSILKAIDLPIQRADWRLDPNGAPPEVVALVADDLRLPVLGEDPHEPVGRRRGRVSWSEHLQQVLLALQYGCMFFEQVYTPGSDGRMHLRKLAPRFPGSLSKVNVAVDGGLESIEQPGVSVGKARASAVVIPVDRLVAYVHSPTDTSWTGTSVLRPAYKHWRLRDQMLRLEAQVLERNGMGVPIYEGSQLTNDPESDLKRGQKLAEGIRAGQFAGGAVPAGAKLNIQGVSGQLVSPREAIAYHDSQMAKAVLAHFLNLEGKGGSYALAETQSDLFIQSLQTIADWIADTATQHVVEDLVDMAFPGYEGVAPRVVVDPIASKKELTADDLSKLTSGDKPVIQSDKDLEEHIRRTFSLPAKRPLKEAVKDGSTPPPDDKKKSMDPDEMNKLVTAATGLFRAGFDPQASLAAVGLPPVKHTGKEPVTVRDPKLSDAEAEKAAAEAAEATGDDPGEPPGEEVQDE
ncbi:phage portal protein family protein [Corynebacterium nuruki]|uniref:phage portal protein family protein n=1 Tax=Corynebacterium nuruki TaxID=1032851 RepID=UPI0002485E21|nr:hypothetical protein [Corynebacterium nuruki]